MGPSAALVSCAELGGAEAEEEEEKGEEVAAAESDAGLFAGAPLACLFIYLSLVCASAGARSTTRRGGGGGEGPREKGAPEPGPNRRVTCR